MTKRVIYGESNYVAVVRGNGYMVDKTAYIAKLESVKNPIFLRPRRFGKSYFCSMLRYYYDLNYAAHFDELFGHTWIGQNPTANHNQHIILFFNFSQVDLGKTVDEIEHSFKNHGNSRLERLRHEHQSLLGDMPEIDQSDSVSDNLSKVLDYILGHQLPQIYVIIDECDKLRQPTHHNPPGRPLR